MKNIILILLFLLSCTSDNTVYTVSREYHLPTITVKINGVSFEMIVDTGGGVTVLDDDAAKKANIHTLPYSIDIVGYGGTKALMLSDNTDIYVGKNKMSASTYITDLEYITRDSNVDGILGVAHMSSAGAIIDLKTNTIKFE